MSKLDSYRGGFFRSVLARRGATVAQTALPWRDDLAAVRETRERAPLLMQDVAALQILACVRATRHLGGTMAEAGVFAGATARLICLEKGDAPLRLFDVFETLQSPASAEDSPRAAELRRHFKTVHTRRADVEALLSSFAGVHVHPGVFPDSARGLEDERFAFVHLDLDLEGGTHDALEFFHPRLLAGGIIVGDDHQDPGVRRAFSDFFAGRADTVIAQPWGQVLVIKSTSSTST
jgi:O-methyltransferase